METLSGQIDADEVNLNAVVIHELDHAGLYHLTSRNGLGDNLLLQC